MSETKGKKIPVNFFGDEAPGKGLSENVEDEKMKILRLVAEHGATGQRIYDEAARRQKVSRSSDKTAATAGNFNVPIKALQEVATEYDAALSSFTSIMADNAQYAREDTTRRQSIEAIYKDSVSGDASLEANAQDAIDQFIKDRDARNASRRRGSGDSKGSTPSSPLTVPEGYVNNPDPEGLYPTETGSGRPHARDTGLLPTDIWGSGGPQKKTKTTPKKKTDDHKRTLTKLPKDEGWWTGMG